LAGIHLCHASSRQATEGGDVPRQGAAVPALPTLTRILLLHGDGDGSGGEATGAAAARRLPSWVRHNAALAMGRIGPRAPSAPSLPPPSRAAVDSGAGGGAVVAEEDAGVTARALGALEHACHEPDPAGLPARTGVAGGSWVVRGNAEVALQRWRWLLRLRRHHPDDSRPAPLSHRAARM
jgi:hypothetical protein